MQSLVKGGHMKKMTRLTSSKSVALIMSDLNPGRRRLQPLMVITTPYSFSTTQNTPQINTLPHTKDGKFTPSDMLINYT